VGSPVTAITLTLPAPADISATWQTAVQNASAGAITVDPNGGLIDGVSGTLSLSAGAGLQLYCDGSNYFTERGSGGTGAVNKYDTSFSSVTSLTVTHGLGTLAVQVSVYDSSGNLIVPSSVEVTGINTVAITFGSSTTGSVVVIG
jgi:streptogramin lyase